MGLLSRRWSTATLGGAALLLVLAAGSSWISSSDDIPAMRTSFSPLTRVTQGPFEIHVTAAAVVDAKHSITLSSELPSNRAKIVYLAAEGDLLESGDVVARFDPNPFQEDILRIEGEIEELRAALMQARADQALQREDALARKADINYQVVLAGLRKSQLEGADIPAREQHARKELARASAELKRATLERTTQEQLVEQGLARRSELQAAIDAEELARAAFDIAERELHTLLDISFPSERQQAELELANRQREQSSFDEIAKQREIKQEASILRLETRLASLQQELEKTHQYLKLTTLTTPVTGIVLYKKVSHGIEKRKPQVGDSLWNRHAFAVIPDLSSLVAFADIDEKDIGKVAVGQSTVIRPEAYTDMTLRGVVDSVGTLAAEDNGSGATRYFRVRIALEDIDQRLRPGMSARAAILTNAYEDVIKVPLEAVFYEGHIPVGFVRDGGGHRRVELDLGETDGDHIVVKRGLEVGQQVSLVYPDEFDR